MRRFSIFNLIGVGFLIAALYLCHGAVTEYAADVESQNWPQTTAIVTDITSREIRSSGGSHTSRYRIVYDISYAYQAGGSEYEGLISGTSHFRVHGEEVQIKYDPDAPQLSTATLAPSLYNLIVPLIASVVFGIVGFFTSGLWGLLRRRKRTEPEEPEPMEAYMPEEPVKPDPVPSDVPGKLRYYLKITVILVVFLALLAGVVLFVIGLGEEKEPVTAEQVRGVLLEQGFETMDVTQRYSESWQIPQEEALCVQEPELLLLFIQLDGEDRARDLVDRLYSYSLDEIAPVPELEYKYSGNNFVVHAMEGGEMYAMHIRVGDTVVYAQCAENRAAEVVAILDLLHYFN